MYGTQNEESWLGKFYTDKASVQRDLERNLPKYFVKMQCRSDDKYYLNLNCLRSRGEPRTMRIRIEKILPIFDFPICLLLCT